VPFIERAFCRPLPSAADRGCGCREDRPLVHRDRQAQRPASFCRPPRQWIVDRTFAWIRRKRHAGKAAAFVRRAMIRLMLRRSTAPFS
jgi:hypothetical protein